MSTCVGLDMRSYPCSPRPLAVVGGKIFSSVSVGGDHVCAIESGTALAYCWGSNASGQLGLGAMLSVGSDLVLQPTMPVGPPGESATWLTFNSISAGGSSTCGITTSQQLYCWGAGHGGPSPVLTSVLGTSATYASVSVGQWSTCALDTSGHTCAGTYAPYSVLGQATTATHFCQIFWGQATECWGDNSYGKAGQDTSIRFIPAASPNPIVQPITGVRYGFTAVAAGAFHTCSLYEGLATCWGHNAWNDLGRGGLSVNQTSSPQAVTMPTNTTFTAISVGAGHTCAIDAQGGVWCWGLNNMGQIGIGSSTNPAMPGPGGSFSLGVAIPTHALNP
jgi:alpha-tubulin suppressor-like RCC1 family protein